MHAPRVSLAILLTLTTAAAATVASAEEVNTPFVYVCKDGGAGGYESFPDLCRLADGRLMCVFYAAYQHIGRPNANWPKGGRASYCISSDEGATWSPAETLFDTPADDRDPSITQLKDGRLLCSYFTIPEGTWLISSSDVGKTWSEPLHLTKADYYVSSPVRELSDGTLVLGLYYQKKKEAWGAVVTSHDGGRTWSDVIDIPNGGHVLDAETDVIELKDHSLLAALRSTGGEMCWSKSTDGGKTWSTAESFGRRGQCPYLHRAPTGEILLGHRTPQTALSVSDDDGKTWAPAIMVDDFRGAYPSMVTLKDGTILIVYYEDGPTSNIRAKRFSVHGTKIEWLPPYPAGSQAGNPQ